MYHHVTLVFVIIVTVHCQQRQNSIRIALIDNGDNPQGVLDVTIPNVIYCGRTGLTLQLHWLHAKNSSLGLIDDLESLRNTTNVYLAHTNQFHTQIIRGFCQTYQIPFFSMQSYACTTMFCSAAASMASERFVVPDILHALTSHLKYHHVQKAAYIYNNDEAIHHLYELMQLTSNDEYFNNFSLNIRMTRYEDIYSMLYSIESSITSKNPPIQYILLDLDSYKDYEQIFDRISHMGLTSDLYHYVILSTFDVCSWISKLDFKGRITYFDYQHNDCIVDYQQQSTKKNVDKSNVNSSSPSDLTHPTSYYRSKLTFRGDPDSFKPSNSTQSIPTNSSSLFSSSSDGNNTWNTCGASGAINEEYISFSRFNSQLPKFYRSQSRPLFDALNLIIRMFTTDSTECLSSQFFAQPKNNSIDCNLSDINVFTAKPIGSNQIKRQVELVGRYSSTTDDYQSCSSKRKTSLSSSRSSPLTTYYITSLFDEPFLMLRKRTPLHVKYSHPQADLKELQGRTFEFHELEGFCVDLAEKVCSVLNITCKFRIVGDGNFGSKNASTGLWNGMIGELVSRTAEMAIAPLTISQKRMEVVDFSKPFMNLGISIMIRKPDAQKPGVFSFMNPVSMEIWLCLSLAYFAVSVILFLTSRVVNSGWRRRVIRRPSYRSFSYPKSVNDRRKSEIQLQRQKRGSIASDLLSEEPTPPPPPVRRRHRYRSRHRVQFLSDDEVDKKKRQEEKDEQEEQEESEENAFHLFGISNALFFSFASFMRQSINLVPKSFSGRIAATSWWYFSLIFVSSYTANLVAFLTVEKLVTPIESVEDLAKQHEIKYGSLRNGTTSAFFEKSNVSVFQHMWAVMQRSSAEVFVATNDEGVAKVRNSKGKYAFFIESTKNEYVNERLPCDTMKVGSDLDSKGYGIGTRIGSDLREAINIIVTELRESGFLDKLKQSWWYERSECSQSAKDKRFSELSLSSVTGLFYIFLFGIIISCAIAFVEFLITAKAESEKLGIDFREILRIKMIENMIGVTIHAQRQLEFGRIQHECNYEYHDEDDEMIEQYTQYQLNKPQSDV